MSETTEPLAISIKRWPDREMRFQLSRPTRRPPLSMGLSLSELRELVALGAEVEALLVDEAHLPSYGMDDLKRLIADRKTKRGSGPSRPQGVAA